MNITSTTIRARHGQTGYALMLVVFFVALLTISVAAVAPSVITSVRREREEEMIWRGKQYVRGIRLYYRKTHKFPTNLEDLYKPKTGIRIMRQAYKDPMNTEDGAWRLIYVGPNGALIGSLKDRSVNLAGQAMGGFGDRSAGLNSGLPGGSSMFGSSNGFGSASSFGSSNSSFGPGSSTNPTTTPGQTPTTVNGQPAGTDPTGTGDSSLQPAPLSSSPIFGGNIIGVGSKINKKSIIWFEKAKNYQQYEFIWDPSVNPVTGARPGINTNSGNAFGTPGGTATGSPFSNGTNPNPTPNPTPNPPQNSPGNPDPPLQAPPN